MAVAPPIRIVVDPGHGGNDTGCSSATGLSEKDLVLDVALKTQARLEQAGGFDVLVTRTEDKFVALFDRTAFANTQQAELLLSLHANFSLPDTVSGFEVYYNSDKDLDEEAAAAAALEAAQIEISGETARNPLARFLWNLTQEKYLEQSSRFADQMQRSLARTVGKGEGDQKLPNRGVRSQVFHVLNGAAMPAVLVEMGFLSCPRDDSLLQDPAFRDKYADGLAAGIVDYAPYYRAESRPQAAR